MEFKPGDRIVVRWPLGPMGRHQRAHVLLVPGGATTHYQIQFEVGARKLSMTKAELLSIFVSVDNVELKTSLGDMIAAKTPKPIPIIDIGSRVRVERPDRETRDYVLVAVGEGNQANNEIDSSLPIGRALIGIAEGEEIEVNGVRLRILRVENPDEPLKEDHAPERISSIDSVILEADKSAVVFGDLFENMIVMSPPGTGKSFALAHKSAFFVEKKNVSPGEILVLSFSREAVAEVKRRLQNFDIPNVGLVQPFTVDSFAATVLLTENRNYVFESYEKSISDALHQLGPGFLERFKHIFIDEFQDVVGVRAAFIARILEMKPKSCGATLLGDIEQAIYHWSLNGQESQIRSEEFLRTAIQILGTGKNFKYLTTNFRISDPELKNTMNGFREFLEKEASQSSGELQDLAQKLVTRIRQLPASACSGAEKYLSELRPETGIRKCVLFRDNGQLIAEAALVQKLKLRPKILGKHNRGLLPSWYASLMKTVSSRANIINRDSEFEEWFGSRHVDEGWTAGEAWNLLKGIEGTSQNSRTLDIIFLKKRIQYLRDIPMVESELRGLHEASLVFSTYHASKGLEFEKVFLVEPEISRLSDHAAFLDEARMFYVGLTRAKRSITLLGTDSVESLRSKSYQIGKIEERRWYRKEGDFLHFNVDNEFDVEPSSFIVPFGFCDVDEVQDILAKFVKEGDPVELRLCEPPRNEFFKTYYIFWRDKAIGSMSKSFYDSILRLYHHVPPLVIKASVGRKYSEFRCNQYLQLDELFSNRFEAWLAIKLGGLAKALR